MPRVLIVEDVRSIRVLIRLILEMNGFEVEEVEHGGLAMDRLQTETAFDVVITDLRMPEVDGFQLMAWIRQNKPSIPVLVITGFPHECEQYLGRGATACLAKPFTATQLVNYVSRLANGQLPAER